MSRLISTRAAVMSGPRLLLDPSGFMTAMLESLLMFVAPDPTKGREGKGSTELAPPPHWSCPSLEKQLRTEDPTPLLFAGSWARWAPGGENEEQVGPLSYATLGTGEEQMPSSPCPLPLASYNR